MDIREISITERIITVRNIIILFGFLFSCDKSNDVIEQELKVQLDSIKNKFILDDRLAVFEYSFSRNSDHTVVILKTSDANVVDYIHDHSELFLNIKLKIDQLPNGTFHPFTYGIVNNSYVNMRLAPKFSSGMAKQVLLGELVLLMEKKANWYRIRCQDGYIGWVPIGGMHLISEDASSKWRASEKIIYTQPTGNAVGSDKASIISNLVFGNVLEMISETEMYFEVGFPDGRRGFIRKDESDYYNDWLATRVPSQQNIISSARSFIGTPYNWGGNTYHGVDCSGYTQSVYYMNGINLPRDADMQSERGVEIDTSDRFNNLNQGDLLFFGQAASDSTKEKISHVSIWLGNGEFIHSQGNVKVGSFNPDDDHYDHTNLKRLVKVKRLNEVSSN